MRPDKALGEEGRPSRLEIEKMVLELGFLGDALDGSLAGIELIRRRIY